MKREKWIIKDGDWATRRLIQLSHNYKKRGFYRGGTFYKSFRFMCCRGGWGPAARTVRQSAGMHIYTAWACGRLWKPPVTSCLLSGGPQPPPSQAGWKIKSQKRLWLCQRSCLCRRRCFLYMRIITTWQQIHLLVLAYIFFPFFFFFYEKKAHAELFAHRCFRNIKIQQVN